MVNQLDRTTYRRWKVILDVERFIEENDDGRFGTRKNHWGNYFCQLSRLWNAKQLIVQRNDVGTVVGVCGWLRVKKEDEYGINKIKWQIPENISKGQTIYVSFCVLKGGSIREIAEELRDKGAIEAFWYNVKNNRYVRVKKQEETKDGNT